MVIDIIRLAHALISKQATASPAAPDEYFANVTEWSFVSKTILYTLQTLLGDAVVVGTIQPDFLTSSIILHSKIYRCYVVWRSLQIVTFLLFLWCSVAGKPIMQLYLQFHTNEYCGLQLLGLGVYTPSHKPRARIKRTSSLVSLARGS